MNKIIQKIYNNFYTTPRFSVGMTDYGGPFGFDIHFAIEVDYLINMYKCDAIFETGTNIGDTTEFLSKMYPEKTIITSEINKDIFDAAKVRLANKNNIILNNESSEIILEKYKNNFNMPFYYLDAHWYEYWPLKDELNCINRGIICVSDFVLGENKDGIYYAGDSYDGVDLDHKFLLEAGIADRIYVNNHNGLHNYPLPCLQQIRRTGRAYFCKDVDDTFFKTNPNFFIELN
jgi:hypothetical protein